MAEYPSQTCGPCDEKGRSRKAQNPTYYTTDSIPEPKVKFKDNSNLNEHIHGVSSTKQNPDLSVSPLDNKDGNPYEKNYAKHSDCSPPCKEPSMQTSKECQPSCFSRVEESTKGVPNIDCPELDKLKDSKTSDQPKKGILKTSKSAELAQTVQPTQTISQPPCSCNCAENSGEMRPTADRAQPTVGFAEPPTAKQPVSNEIPPLQQEEGGPCYLPQPQDAIPIEETGNMGPIGPWATGRVDWGPLGGLTGTRPVVDKYSIARYSEGDWRAHNKVILEMSNTEQHRANLVDWNGRQCLEQSQAEVATNQDDNTKKLHQRELEIHRWKCELERAIAAASEEILFMEEQRRRLKQASAVLTWPESIAGECLERRTGRMDVELVRDEVEEELIKELALCSEIRDIFTRTLKDVEKQLVEDKTAKQKLEMDWSDKTIAHEIDSINMALNCRSTVLLFKPGSVIFPEGQSSTDYWEHFTREALLEGEATRQRSVTLRGTLDAILTNAARDLRTQADRVEMALAKRIACTEEVTKKLEFELMQVLRRLADVEDLMKDLRDAIRRMDTPMKKAQTRLDNRLQRPRIENCRDAVHFGLVNEVKSIAENVAALQAQLNEAERSQTNLINARSELEREIMLKRKTLEIDRDRTKRIRSFYPSATALAGH